jgi:hypothetical protein
MARSLTVAKEENPRTSLLFFGFFVLAVGWLALATSASGGANDGDLSGFPIPPAADAR